MRCRGRDHLAGLLAVRDRLLRAGDLAAECRGGNQAGRIVRTSVDLQAGAQAGQRRAQLAVRVCQICWAMKSRKCLC